ncbi:hypothetical protein TH0757_05810 [Helicobacter pylori]
MRKIVKKLGRSFKTFMLSKRLVKNSKTRALKSQVPHTLKSQRSLKK